MARPLAAVLLAASAFLAGCAEGPAAERVVPDETVLEENAGAPVLEGVVTDLALVPLAGANVTLVEHNLTTRTDARGLFRFSPAPLGSVLVAVNATGFKPSTLRFDLERWRYERVAVKLTPDARAPRVERLELAAYLSCHARAAAGGLRVPVDCGASDPSHAPVATVPLARGAGGLALRVAWTPSTPVGTTLNVTVKESREAGLVGDGVPIVVFATAEGASPLDLAIPLEALHRANYQEGGDVKVVLSAPDGALVLGQRVSVLAAVFYDGAPFDPHAFAE